MRFLRRSLLGLFLMSLTLGLLATAGGLVRDAIDEARSDAGPTRAARERVFAVNTFTLEPGTVAPRIETFGEIRSRRTLELRSAAAGEIVWLADEFEEGARVTAGAVLARIDDRDAKGRRDTARADLAEAENDVADAERALALADDELASAQAQADLQSRALTRQRDLLDRGVGSASAVETAELASVGADAQVLSRRQALASARTRLDQARTTVERRRIALEEAERRLDDTKIIARFDGVLSDVTAVEGGLVNSNEKLADLVDPGTLEASFRLSAGQYARLLDSAGALMNADVTVTLDVSGIDLVAVGRITRDAARVGEGQTGRELFARLEDAAGLRPGDFVTVRITEPALQDVTVLPATALDASGTVLVIGEDNRLEVAPVTILRRQGDDVIVRARDLAGRLAVAERTPFLGAGIRVKPLTPGGAETQPTEDEMVTLDADRRARLVAFVEGNARMPEEAKERVLAQLREEKVPASMVNRLESRMGG